MTKPLRSLVSLLALGCTLRSAHAWGANGHEMQARAAVGALPPEVPAFFRGAAEPLAQLVTEPDRWRTANEPELDEVTGVNHTFRWEIAPHPLPANRHLFIIELAQAGKLEPKSGSVREFGTAPYGIQEWAEMLTGDFRRWRGMPETTPTEVAHKRFYEQTILFVAAVLGHWVTDMSQPMHASIHVHGWSPSVPNPHHYDGKNLHGRYESTYVNRVIQQSDVTQRVAREPKLLGPWLPEVEKYVAATNSHVEQVFIWDQQARFGSGNEPAEAKPFTAQRLADGAQMLRDVWYTAWIRSAEPMGKKRSAKTAKDDSQE